MTSCTTFFFRIFTLKLLFGEGLCIFKIVLNNQAVPVMKFRTPLD